MIIECYGRVWRLMWCLWTATVNYRKQGVSTGYYKIGTIQPGYQNYFNYIVLHSQVIFSWCIINWSRLWARKVFVCSFFEGFIIGFEVMLPVWLLYACDFRSRFYTLEKSPTSQKFSWQHVFFPMLNWDIRFFPHSSGIFVFFPFLWGIARGSLRLLMNEFIYSTFRVEWDCDFFLWPAWRTSFPF